jgi:hypothetical protein
VRSLPAPTQVRTKQLVGIMLFVYVKEELLRHVHDVDDSYVGVGVMNIMVRPCLHTRAIAHFRFFSSPSPDPEYRTRENLGERLVHFVLKAKTVVSLRFFVCGTFSTFLYGNGSHSNRATVTPDRATGRQDATYTMEGYAAINKRHVHNAASLVRLSTSS